MRISICRACHQFYFGDTCNCKTFICKSCGTPFRVKEIKLDRYGHPRKYSACPDCKTKFGTYTLVCPTHGVQFANGPITACPQCKKEKKPNSKQLVFKQCTCGNLYFSSIKQTLCNKCQCKNLGKWLGQSDDQEVFEVRRQNGSRIMKKLHEQDQVKFCSKCQQETKHITGVGCMRCHNNSEIMRQATTRRNLYNWANDLEYRKRISQNLGEYVELKYVRNADGEITHIIVNNEQKLLNEAFGFEVTGFFSNGDQVTNNVVTAYRWLENGLKVSPIDEETYRTKVVNQKYVRDEGGRITHIMNGVNKIPLDLYLKLLQKKLDSQNMKQFEDLGFIRIPTGMNGNGSEGRALLNQELVKRNIKWFVYVVPYVKNNKLHPLKICKSGSPIVNSGGCDVSYYRTHIDMFRPSTQFILTNEDVDYYSGELWIKKFESEEEALNEEWNLLIKTDCFS